MFMLKLNNLYDNPGANHKSKRVGRGIGSGKGKTCGRGVKGQKARSGVAIKGFEGGQMPLIKRLPKRGFNPINREAFVVINLARLAYYVENSAINANDEVNRELLVKIGFIKKSCKDKIKILAEGEINAPLVFNVDVYSEAAKAKILAAGGKIIPEVIWNQVDEFKSECA